MTCHSCFRPDEVDCTVNETLAVFVFTFYLFHVVSHTPVELLDILHVQEYHWKFPLKLRLSLNCSGARYLCCSDFSWFVRLHSLGVMVPQFAHWSIGNFLHPYGSHRPFTSVLTIKIIKSLPVRHSCISTADTQTCLQALNLLSAYNTLHSARISSGYAKKTYFESGVPVILPTSERGDGPI